MSKTQYLIQHQGWHIYNGENHNWVDLGNISVFEALKRLAWQKKVFKDEAPKLRLVYHV